MHGGERGGFCFPLVLQRIKWLWCYGEVLSDGKGWVGCVAALIDWSFYQKIALDCIEFVENKASFCKWVCGCSSYRDHCMCTMKS